ncbi:glycosyltransferase [Mycolicibacterium murale]|nr:glycosyltransferase [Mycolicibacterium murale]
MTYPMHGQWKLASEGYRTRDGHFIEWLGRKVEREGPVTVISRPEPLILPNRYLWKRRQVARNTVPLRAVSLNMPSLSSRQDWWVASLDSYPACVGVGADTKIVSWNPFLALSSGWATIRDSDSTLIFDLLDDWTLHYAFQGIAGSVADAYSEMFSRANYVTANAEGTLELAHRFGRRDCEFIPNGCDPDRFSTVSRASGPLTVGYVGKIGRRLDLDLILDVCRRCPSVSFVFAGPILDSEYKEPLAAMSNVSLLGDVHYENVPQLLETFDIGWVPHNVGKGEVGGDVIKTYEYRAAGLPVLTTPIAGAGKRSLDHVYVIDRSGHANWLLGIGTNRPERQLSPLPAGVTWESKTDRLLSLLGYAGGG